MTDRHLCIHGHFYQPPRENPWIGAIETQPTAKPFHDWNERITRECYTPNGWSRVLGEGGRVARLINNYEYISFNFGPTLLGWLEHHHPLTHTRLQEADQASQKRCGGHGNALAQVYNHIIMPLANTRDKQTQIRWGKMDFRRRFGRDPEGMWLAEAAVDMETLVLLAREGVRFTILAPDQAAMVRPLGAESPAAWRDVTGGRVDPRQPYRVFLDPANRSFIDVFFYDGPISRAIAYERLLGSGSHLLARIEQAFGQSTGWPRLVNLATDGESYGHHFSFGDMALAWLVDQLRDGDSIRLTNYGEFLDRNPPRSEARIVERSSWSCAHGVGRWKTDCGCHVGGEPGWNQQWRGPLRDGLDGLRDELALLYETAAAKWLRDPWAARDDYLAVRLDPGPASRDGFFNAHAIGALAEQDRGRVLGLLESQVMALFMFTSCGWFFDDISGLEPIQDLQYAARAIDLVREWAPPELEDRLLNHLARAKANDPDYTDGADVYRKEVLPARMDPSRVAAHWVFGQLSEEAGACPVAGLARPVKKRRFAELGLTVAAATVDVTDPYTLVSTRLACLGLSSGGADLAARVGPMPLDLDALTDPVTEALTQADMDRLTELMDQALPGARAFGLDGLILDTRNRLLRGLSKGFFDDLRIFVLNQYDRHRDVLSLFRDAGLPTPEAEDFIFGTVIGVDLERILGEGREPGTLDLGALEALAQRSRIWGVAPSRPWLTQVINDFLRYRFELLAAQPDAASLKELAGFLDQARRARRDLDLWESQNTYDDLARSKDFQARLTPDARGLFAELGRSLGYLL